MTDDHQVIQVSSVDGTTVVCFKDLATVQRQERFRQVEEEMWALVDQQKPTSIILDFENKELLTGHVVQDLLIRLHKRLNDNFMLCNLPPLAMEHFELNHLADLLNIYRTREDALADVRS